MSSHDMSRRGWANVESIMPVISAAVEERSRPNNPNIDLSVAENWLIRPEMLSLCKAAVETNLEPAHFSYQSGFAGDADLLEAFAAFFNTYFHPHVPVTVPHLALAPGAAACLDALLYNICDPGDGVLLPAPYWNAFNFLFRARSSMVPVPVIMPDLASTLTNPLLLALDEAFDGASCSVKALVLTNPNNPLGQCYPRDIIEGCMKFCHRRGIHFISDEIYALTSFASSDLPDPTPFVSALSLDVNLLGCDPSKVHVVWSTSKDFGQNGVRIGSTVTQKNERMAVGCALASNTQTSSLSAVFITALLKSPRIPSIIALNNERLATGYNILTTFLKRQNVQYFPCNAGLYVFAKMAKDAQSWDDEVSMVQKFKKAGVLISAGKGYMSSQPGWMRVGFAVEQCRLEEAVRRMEGVFLEPDKYI